MRGQDGKRRNFGVKAEQRLPADNSYMPPLGAAAKPVFPLLDSLCIRPALRFIFLFFILIYIKTFIFIKR